MSQYYLMAQLPSLDGAGESVPLPITEDRFVELCRRFLGKKALVALEGLTLTPPRNSRPTRFALIDGWNSGERRLRLALGRVRGETMKKPFDPDEGLPTPLLQVARAAVELQDPLAAERYLNRYRLDFLESLRPTDPFCEDAVFYYGLKLKLLRRMQLFDESRGSEAYRSIYTSILNGEKREAEE